MRKIKRIIPDFMMFTIGMVCGKCIFDGIEIWKTAIIGMAIFTVLWFLWDAITEQKRSKQQDKRNKKEKRIA